MSIYKQFFKNTSILGIGKIIENILTYLIIILISRELGAQGLGQYSFLFAFSTIFIILTDIGLADMFLKDLSKNFTKAKKYLNNIITFKLLLITITLTAYLIIIQFIGKNELIPALIIVVIIHSLTTLNYLFTNLLRIKHKSLTLSISSLVERTITFIGAAIILPITKNLTHFMLILLLSNIIYITITYISTKKYFQFKLTLNKTFLKSLLKKSYPFMLIGIFMIIYVELDSIMLSFMQTDIIVGWYNAGYKLINVLNIIPVLILTFGYPIFAQLYKTNKQEFKHFFEQTLYYSLLIIIPIATGVLFIGERILNFIYHFNSPESALAFKILIIAEIFVFLTTIMGYMMASADNQKTFAKISGSGALLNIILNFALIPKYSLYGAAIATTTTYLIMFILMYIYIKLKIINFKFFKYLILPILASTLMAITISLILNYHTIIIITIGAITYAIPIVIWESWKYNKKKKI